MLARNPPALKELRAQVREGALNRPGIYRMMGRSGVVIYVGKSKQLRTRLLGYFRARSNEKGWRIVRDALAIDWEYVPSEFASLLRELELIKRHRPPYNVRSKRDGVYCFVRLTGGVAPRIHVIRRLKEDGGNLFGPFPGGQRIVDAVRELNDVLQLRDCRTSTPIRFADQADLFGTRLTPLCPRQELLRCCAPCAAGCSAAEYTARIRQARAFLRGEGDEPLRRLQKRMNEASDRLEFELAASLRNRLERLEMLRSEFRRLREATEGLSFLYAVPGYGGDHRVYAIRSGSIRDVYQAPKTAKERRDLLQKAGAHFAHPEATADTAAPARVDELLLVAHWFRTRRGEHSNTYPRASWNRLPLAGQMEEQLPVA